MQAYKAYKFRLYPDSAQAELINRTIGCARLVYNLLLNDRKEHYDKHKEMLKREVTYYKKQERYSFLNKVDSLALANAKMHLEAAYKNFFNKKTGFPKFKCKGKNDTYTTNRLVSKSGSSNIELRDGYIKLPKLKWVKVHCHREIPVSETINSCTISRKAGKYYISILVEYEKDEIAPITVSEIPDDKIIGLDYSVPSFYVDSDGNKPDFHKNYRKAEKRLKRLQKQLSHKKKGSKNRHKVKLRLQKVHQKVANQRLDFCYKEAKKLADLYDVVCMEDINLRNMSKSLKLGKSVMDCGFGMFRAFLKDKMDRKGGYVICIDKWYPSSKLCHACGYKNKELTLSDREWTCPACGTFHDRDTNAAINIKTEGTRILAGF